MAVKKYHQHFALELFLIFLATQIVAGCVLYAWQDLMTASFGIQNEFLRVAVPFLVLELIASAFVLAYAVHPLRKIESAVSYATKNSPDDQQATESLFTLIKAIRHIDASKGSHQEKDSTEFTFSQSILDHLPIGILALNPKKEIVYSNIAAPLHAGGKQINLDFIGTDTLDTWLKSAGEKSINATKWWRRIKEAHPENEDQPLFFDVLALYQQSGDQSIETIIVTINRTEQYGESEIELDFTALAAHELRGPITVIKGYLDVLRQELDATLSEDQKAFFERLDVSADRLSMYINNILNVSRYDRRHLQLHLKEEKLSTVFQTVIDDLDLRAKTLHRLLNVNLPEDLPTIAADRGSLSEVIVNLVDNAIKYSSEGGLVVVTAQVKGDFVEVSVQDNGIGIPASLMGHLFDKFYRSHRSRENTVGTGLGLYITKAIIESHGGIISARSEESHGSVFTFSIPIYAKVADKLKKSDNNNTEMIKTKKYIKNHSLYRG